MYRTPNRAATTKIKTVFTETPLQRILIRNRRDCENFVVTVVLVREKCRDAVEIERCREENFLVLIWVLRDGGAAIVVVFNQFLI